jgi:hypothetical protein
MGRTANHKSHNPAGALMLSIAPPAHTSQKVMAWPNGIVLDGSSSAQAALASMGDQLPRTPARSTLDAVGTRRRIAPQLRTTKTPIKAPASMM